MGRKLLPRLSVQDCKDLLRGHEYLLAADAALASGNWQAAPAVRSLIGHCDRVIADLYNKAEKVFLELQTGKLSRMVDRPTDDPKPGENPNPQPGAPQAKEEG